MLGLILLLSIGCRREDGSPAESPSGKKAATAAEFGSLDQPVVLIGVDGLEWNVLLPMMRDGDLPVMTRLMEEGAAGRLETFSPTRSPVIWTSMATGKVPTKHGIGHFYFQDQDGNPRLFSNRNRKTKALWNIFSDYRRTVHCLGWWMTFPAEEIRGTMVAQTNTLSQIRTTGGRAVWKGSVLRGLSGQVYPETFQNRVLDIADAVEADLPDLIREEFGSFKYPHSELTRRLWLNTLWAIRADTIYLRVARRLLASGDPPELLLLYFGGTDVVAHRFWRYMYPEEFTHKPSPEEVENFADVIRNYYRYVDSAIGTVLKEIDPEAHVFIVSDHGMHAFNQQQRFDPDLPPADIQSAAHEDGPPGIIITAGKYIQATNVLDVRRGSASPSDLPTLGSVLDLAPTILVLKGLPIGQDMDGTILDEVLVDGFLDAHPPTYVRTHDTEEWIAARPDHLLTPEAEKERLDQLRALGYIQ
ncbi:MAG: hypothetical protein GY856_01530 [bacterium]|nr:hypothetical protein [bacterium]